MTHDQVQEWLDRYVTAWRSSDAVAITGLFSEDAVHGYRPWDSDEHTVRGNHRIAASWLERRDDPASWEAAYAPYAVDGDKAVALGTTRYFATANHQERLYHNAFILAFDAEGRCTSFHEFYLQEKD